MFKKPLRKTRTTAPWISDATWRLVDQRTELRRKLTVTSEIAGRRCNGSKQP